MPPDEGHHQLLGISQIKPGQVRSSLLSRCPFCFVALPKRPINT
jgi:hypothetical protein